MLSLVTLYARALEARPSNARPPKPRPPNARPPGACALSIANARGNAMLETVPLLVIFVMMLGFGMGFWGVIHTATLNSIAARTYAFEVFRQRTSIVFHREDGTGVKPGAALNYSKKGWRFLAVNHEHDQRDKFVATTRPIALGKSVAGSDSTEKTHNVDVYGILSRNERTSVNPVWVMVGYGICMNQACGGADE